MALDTEQHYLDPFDDTSLRVVIQQRLSNAVLGDPGQDVWLLKPTMIGPLSTLLDVDHTSMLYKAIGEALETENAQVRYDFFENLAEWMMDESPERLCTIFQDGYERRDKLVFERIISDRSKLRESIEGSAQG